MEKIPNGFTFYKGPSALDGRPILGIVTGLKQSKRHQNKKTGAMVQVYILALDESPTEARKSGLDAAICGEGIHRIKGTCYVRVETGPLIVWKSYQRGNYPEVSPRLGALRLAGRMVRLGAYGDPAAIPFSHWKALLSQVADVTGYSHAWKEAKFAPFRRYVMASCDTAEEYQEAKAQGWRAFYVVPTGYQGKPDGAFLCPASEEAGRKVTCIDCRACNGLSGKARASVFIPAPLPSWLKLCRICGNSILFDEADDSTEGTEGLCCLCIEAQEMGDRIDGLELCEVE